MYQPIAKDTIIRTVIAFVVIINTVLTLFDKNPLPYSTEEIEVAVAAVLDVVTTIWVWWKNNSFTVAARIGDETMKYQKRKRKLYMDNK